MVMAAQDRWAAEPAVDYETEHDLSDSSLRDADAFAHIYDRYGERINHFIRARVPDDVTAEDLTAHVFYRALTSASSFRGEGTYRAWIFQIARNTISTWRERGTREIPVEELPDEPDMAVTPLTIALEGEERDEIRRQVAELPQAQQEVVRLRYWKDLSVDEIAAITRRSSVAVRQLLHRARRQLKRTLSRTDVSVLLGATGASAAIAAYSYRKHKKGDA